MGRKRKNTGVAMLQRLREQPNATPQDLQEQNYDYRELEKKDASSGQSNGDTSLMGQKRKSAGASIPQKLRGQLNAVPQDLQERNYDYRELETEDASFAQPNGDDSLMGRKHKSAVVAMLQRLRGQHNAAPQDLQEQNYDYRELETEDASSARPNGDNNSIMGRKRKSAGAAMLQKLRGQPNEVPQDLHEQNYDHRELETEDASSAQPNGNNSLIGQKRKSAGAAMLQRLRGQPHLRVPQDLQEQNYDYRELETEDASSAQPNGNNSLMGRKHKSAGAAMLLKLRGQPNAVPQDLQEQNYDYRELETEDASSAQPNGDNSLMGQKRKTAGAAMLQKLRGQLNAVPQDLQEQNYNRKPETEYASSPQPNCDNSLMVQKCMSAGAATRKKLRGQSNAVPQDLQEQSYDNREPEIGDASSPEANDDNSFDSSSQAKVKQQKNIDPLLVKIIDTKTKETTLRRMTANEVWNLENNLKVIVELNGNGQGDDSGTNLLVRFLGKLSKNPTLCPITIKSWPNMPKDKTFQQWKHIEDKFLFDYASGCKWVMSNLGERWRSHKYRLRRNYFYPNKTKKEVLDNPPPGVDGAHWTTFVEYYFEKDMKKICHQNSLNREKLKVPHAGGSRSNARKSRQMAEKLGRPVCRGEVVLSNLVREDGSCVNEEGKKLAEKILKFLPQDQEHAATLDLSSSMVFASPYDAIGKVFGAEHSGRVRGMGVGVCPSDVFGLRAQLGLFGSSTQEHIVDLEKQVHTLQEKLNGYDEIKGCISDLVKKVDTLQEKLNGYDEMKTQLAQTQAELRETKAQLLQNQVQMGGLYKFLDDNFG